MTDERLFWRKRFVEQVFYINKKWDSQITSDGRNYYIVDSTDKRSIEVFLSAIAVKKNIVKELVKFAKR